MPSVRLQIDVSGTRGEEVWRKLRHFELAESSCVDSQPEAIHAFNHSTGAVHSDGECIIGAIQVETALLAQYAVAHYLEQDRVLDADVDLD